jgi:predicted nucleic acid-binding protein
MKQPAAILDANVLFSAPARDLLLQLAYGGVFRAHWSADIDDEWKRNLAARRPDLASRLDLTQARMRRAIPDALVTNYAPLIPNLVLPDPGDRHVLAAAIVAKADVIVTYNLTDFPAAALAPNGIEAQHPDAFLKFLADTKPSEFLTGVRTCFGRLTRPPIAVPTFLKNLRAIGLTETAAFLDGKLP